MIAIANKVIVGEPDSPILTFTNDNIKEVVEETASAIIGDELFIDQFLPIVRYGLLIRYVLSPADVEYYRGLQTTQGQVLCTKYNYDIRNIPYGTPVRFYSDNRIVGLFYCDKVERQGVDLFKINCVSAVGLMDKQRHVGGVYTGISFEELLADIIGDYDYMVEPDVASLQVYGWLPYSTRRANLHQLLLAYGVNLTKSDTGGMLFTFLKAVDSYDIPSRRIFDSGSVTYGEPASRVEVIEHGYHYLPSVEYEMLYDTKGESAYHTIVTFDKPIYPDTIMVKDGGTIEIVERGVNYAIINGVGVLIGKPYVHTTKRLTNDNPVATTEKIVTVEDATLITMANAENCLARISEYYFNATTVRNSIIVEGEKTGRRYSFENAFRDYTNAFMSKMSTTVSSFLRSECEYIANYIPIAQGSSFLRRDILPLSDEEQTWTVPDSVYAKDVPQIRVVLIGEGYDGSSGNDGEPGEESTDDAGGFGGAGGKGGKGGAGGKILSVTIDCSSIAFFKYGRSGKDTYINGGSAYYNSRNGTSSSTGFVDMFTGAVYALPGSDGVDGADGGQGGSYPPIGGSGNKATAGGDVEVNDKTFKCGKGANRTIFNGGKYAIHENMKLYYGGGGGGGAAYGSDGDDGTAGIIDNNGHGVSLGYGGDGGDGLDAPEPIDMYGCGGSGGSGGGGGGGGGNIHFWNHVYNTLIAITQNQGGKGGKGGVGTAGRDGVIIIYY